MKRILFLIILSVCFSAAAGADAVPENLELIFDGTQIIVDWDGVTTGAVTEYYVYRSSSPGITETNFDLRVTVTAGTSQYADAVPDTYTPYYYTVQAYDSIQGAGALAPEADTSPYPPAVLYPPEPFNSKIFLRWEENYHGDVSSYSIFRATAPDLFTNTRAAESDNNEYMDEDVVNNTEYFYRIAAYSDYEGRGAYSVVTGAGKPFAPPFTPKPLTINALNTEVSLSWTVSWQGGSVFGSYGIKEFALYRDVAPDFSSQALAGVSPYSGTINVYAASDSGLSPGEVYYYKFMTVDINGNTSYPAYFEFAAQPDSAPSQPQGVTAACGNLTSVFISWSENDAGEAVSSYTIERATESSFDTGLSAYKTYSSSGPPYYDTAPESGAGYFYRVFASNINGAGAASSYAYVTVEAAPVMGVEAAAGESQAEIVISWNAAAASENITLYNVYRAQTEAGLESASPVPGAEGTTLLSFTDTGLIPGEFYYYQAAAVTTTAGSTPEYVTGRRSAAAGAYAIGAPLSAALTAAEGFDSYVYLEWAPADESGATAYNVYRSQSPLSGYADQSGEITNTLNTYYYDTNVVNGNVYYYLVAVGNKFGTSSPDPLSSVYLDVTPAAAAAPPAPLGVAFTCAGDGAISLSWNPVGRASYYNVYRSLYDPPDQYYAQSSSPFYSRQVMTVTDTASVTTTAWHYYRVRAVDVSGNISGYSSSVSGTAFVSPAPAGEITLSGLADSVFLTWEEPDMPFTYPLSGYNIYRSTYAGGVAEAAALSHPFNYYRDYGISRGGTYYYSVRPVDIMGNTDSGGYNFKSITIEGEEDPPMVLYARAADRQVTLIWTLGTPDYYNIYRSTVPSVYGAPIASRLNFDNKEYVDTDSALVNGTIYYYSVTASNSLGEGPKSVQASCMPYKAPDLPSDKNVYTEKREKKDIYLYWNPAAGGSGGGEPALSGYNVYRSADGGAFYTLLSFTADTYYLDETTAWDNTYYYMVKTVDENGNEDRAYNTAVVELAKPEDKIRVFANMIDLSKGESLELRYFIVAGGRVRISIYTLSGEFVKQLLEEEYAGELSETNPYESPSFYWDGTNAHGSKVAAGVYYIIMEAGGKRIIEKAAVVK